MEWYPILIAWNTILLRVKTTHSDVICNKISFFFFSEIEKPTLQFTWNFKGAEIDKTVLKKKNKTGGLTFPYFKTYYKATVIKTVRYWHKDKHTDQLNRRGSRNKPSDVWIFSKSHKQDYSMGKCSFF